MTRILVVSPHPDDEAIGCGGSIARHRAGGDEVVILHLTSGEAGIAGVDTARAAATREAEARDAASILGVDDLQFWRLPDGRLRAAGEIVDRLVSVLTGFVGGIVYVPHRHEDHADHRAANRLVRRAAVASGAEILVREFEVWTPLRRMDHVCDITAHMEAKRAAIRAHASQCELVGFEAAATGLSRYRGELHSWPGGPFAEVFTEFGRPSR